VYYRIRPLYVPAVGVMSKRPWEKVWSAPLKSSPPVFMSAHQVRVFGELIALWDRDGWNKAYASKLALYHLHYFDDLNTPHACEHGAMLEGWIEKWRKDNPVGKGNGWEPYPLSLRLVNWVMWYARQLESPSDACLESLGRQASALAKQIEYSIGANHLFVNAKALVFAGAYLNGPHAARWLKKGVSILDKQIAQQFLKDGAHVELSPMYHAVLLWDMCDLIHVANQTGLPLLLERKRHWEAVVERGFQWLEQLCHPDGEIAFFNDATLSVAPRKQAIQDYMQQLGLNTQRETRPSFAFILLPDSGYGVMQLGAGGKAILDMGRVGAENQPGHAHADTLSFEMSLHAQRFIVNSGISQYGTDAIRQFQRSTKAHSTVALNDENSSEIWGGFRVARRAYPQEQYLDVQPHQVHIACSHNGYQRLPGRNIHRREWFFVPQELFLSDRISGVFTVAYARFYLHPNVHVIYEKDEVVCTIQGGEKVRIQFQNAKKVHLEPATWHPAFGCSVSNTCLVATFVEPVLITHIRW
jgi:uncharacterized heparinase superfamily protein